MNGHRPVFWSQGLFLHPQHFQASEEELHRHVESLRLHGLPYFWGVRRLAWRGGVVDHALEIESLEAIFPSGAVINIPYDTSVAPLALGENWPEPDRPAALYLGLALPNASGNNAAPEGEFAGMRFVYSETPEQMPDVYGASPPAPIHRLRYAPILIKDADLERYTGFETLPIAVVRRVGEHIELDPHFTPPLLCLEANASLSGLTQELQDAAVSCAGRLAGYKPAESAENANMDFIVNFTALGILNRNIPLLAHLRSGANVHPWHVYGVLRQFVGELSTLFDDIDCLGRTSAAPDGIPPYKHENPREVFEPLCALLRKLLNGLGAGTFRTLPLTRTPPYFSADIPEDFISPACAYWLSIRCDGMTEDMTDNILRFAKLGTWDRLNTIITKAVSGVPLTRVQVPPPGFIKNSNTAWFAIDASHPLWRSVVDHTKISLFWESAPEKTQATLVATGR
ncbi:MAG: type VI secretion system baseplate subunit TssK [Desulfovibrio sp.]|jgi:type VI secretion system protein ImpJ|nr:type VI secretion system baseplate subunit TssK [Desulfovibrio sp.]